MRATILIGLVVIPCALSAPGPKDPPPPKPSPLVGEWLLVSLTQNGKESPWTLDESVFAFTADGKYAHHRDGRKDKNPVQYRIDDKADPPTLDLIHPAADMTIRRLYKVDGDTLSICSFEDRTILPKEFEARVGSKNLIIKLSRVKPEK